MKETLKRKIIILKIGGSVITQKHREGIFVRRALLKRIAREIQTAQERNPNIQLIIIHGAGAGGHQLAKKYSLSEGVGDVPEKWRGALLTRQTNQSLNLKIFEIFSHSDIRIVPIHTASIITQKDKKIISCSFEAISQALKWNCTPLLYGELVFDTELGMSICSGDTSAFFLAKHYQAERVLFASDVDGIFNKDPHRFKDAKMIQVAKLSELLADKNIALTGSHSVDVTGGLANKISELARIGLPKSLRNVLVFNGLKSGAFKRALSESTGGTVIEI